MRVVAGRLSAGEAALAVAAIEQGRLRPAELEQAVAALLAERGDGDWPALDQHLFKAGLIDIATMLQLRATEVTWAAGADTDWPTILARAGVTPAVRRIGDYEIVEELGRGAMGVVYRARQVRLGREVALKVLRWEEATESALQRFVQEARAAGALQHPHITAVHDAGEEDGRHYLVMELIDGEDLEGVLERGPLSVDQSLELVSRVARAIHHAHKQGIVHRDLKPANIMLDTGGAPHVSDFGLAKVVQSHGVTRTGAQLGTPVYMAPEQIEGHAIDGRTDVYALGVMLYRMICGRLPYTGASSMELFAQVLAGEPPRPRQLVPGLSVDLETVILHAMAAQPGSRYATAQSFAGDIDRCRAGEPVRARPIGRLRRLARRARRHRALTISIVAGVLVAAVLSGVYLRQLMSLRAEVAARREQRRQARALYVRGMLFGLHKKHRLARAEYGRALEVDPEYAGALFGRGVAHKHLGQLDAAMADLTRAIALDPTLSFAYYERAHVHQIRQDWDAALADYEAMVRTDPDNELGHAGRADILLHLGRTAEAERSYRAAIARRPDVAERHAQLSVVLSRTKRPAEAEASLRTAVELDPGFAAAWVNLSALLLRQRRPQEALAAARKAVSLAPALSHARFNLARAHRALRQDADAARQLEIACILEPDSESGHGMLANVYIDLKRHADALRAVDALVALRPESSSPYLTRAQTMIALGRHADARTALDQALARWPDDKALRFERALLLHRHLGDRPAALADYARVARLDPDFPTLRLQRALCRLAGGDSAAAVRELRELLGGADDRLARRALVEIRLQRRQPAEALRLIEAGLARGAWPYGRLQRGRLLALSGRHREALADLRAAATVKGADGHAARRLLVDALLRTGQLDEGLTCIDGLLRETPDVGVLHEQRGFVLSQQRRWPDALAAFDRAVELAPGKVDTLRNRGMIRFQLGQWAGALADLRKVVALDPDGAEVPALKRRIAELERRLSR